MLRETLVHSGAGSSIVIQTWAASERGLWEPDKRWSKVGHKSQRGSMLLISYTRTFWGKKKSDRSAIYCLSHLLKFPNPKGWPSVNKHPGWLPVSVEETGHYSHLELGSPPLTYLTSPSLIGSHAVVSFTNEHLLKQGADGAYWKKLDI